MSKCISRKVTRSVALGNVVIGGGAPVVVQSMTNTDTRDVKATMDQIGRLYGKGCEVVRCAVVDEEAARVLRDLVELSPIPIVADIHFDYKLALRSIESGVQGVRINPGNIGGMSRVKEIIKAASERGVVIRVGVNSGSVEKGLLDKYGAPTVEALVESALGWVNRFEDEGFYGVKVSIKSSDPLVNILANEKFSSSSNCPLHIGVTEAGSFTEGIVKSVSSLAVLLREGIGDTIRISLSQPPEDEVDVCYELLNALHLREKRGIDFVSCPTCGRIEIDLLALVKELKKRLSHIDKPIKVAVMGCVVNALGEAKESDFAIAGGKGFGLIIRGGKVVERVPEDRLVDEFVKFVEEYANGI